MNKPVRLLMLLLVALGLGTGQAKADGETKVNGVKYLDENGVEHTQDNVTVLTGSETMLEGGWYVVNSDITYTNNIMFGSDVRLILCDGKKMNIGTSESRINGTGIYVNDANLTIYGQSTGDDMGTLSIYVTDHSGIDVGFLTISGGHVIADTDGDTRPALYATNDLTINGGIVEATATGNIGEAIYAGWTFYYAGGIVTTAASNYAIYAGSDYLFSWLNPTDRITIGSGGLYTNNNALAAIIGKRFLAYDDVEGTDASGIVSGTITDLSTFAGKTLRPLAVTETVDGVTTTSPAYCLSVPAGTVVSGKTEADGKTPKPDITIGGKPYYLFKNGDNVSFTLEDRGQDGVEVYGLPIDLAVTDRVPTITFQMRTNDEDVTAKFYIKDTGVKYLDWDDTQKKLVPKNTKDLSPIPKVSMLDGTETCLGESGGDAWYVCNSDVSYDHTLVLNGNVHLILADGCHMNIGTSDARINGYGIIYSGTTKSLTIYGQTNGTGALSIYTTDITGDGTCVGALTINGGHVTADTNGGYASALFTVTGDITINGGTVSATVSGFADAIVADKGNFIYNGGNVTTNGNGILAIGGDITLGWTKPTDFIKTNSYLVDDNKVVKIAEGKNFMVYNGETAAGVISGTVSDLSTINGKKLVPAVPFEIDNPYVVKTFEGNWKVAGGAKTFLPAGYDLGAGQVTLEEVIGAPDGQPVIIGLEDGQNLPATCFLVPALGDEVDDIEDNYDNVAGEMSKRFVITDGTKTLAEVISGTGVDASEAVVLMLVNSKFMTVDISAADLNKKAKAGLLLFVLTKWEYMQIKPATQPASATKNTRAIGIDFGGETTGIKNVHNVQSESWYDLQGRKINKPTKKGVYIRNGRLEVVR